MPNQQQPGHRGCLRRPEARGTGPRYTGSATITLEAMTDLAEWHTRLDRHFRGLSDQRQGPAFRVFALEHGLLAEEIDELGDVVRQHIVAAGYPVDTYLPLVVYAAELGYQYSGDEYWQSFRASTPSWEYSWRERVRSSFTRFSADYNGARPTGRWAEHFGIIAWPITHAILPKDLQQHLIALLHRLRFRFSSELLFDPDQLGAMLHSESRGTSGRFQTFSENTSLLGQIAAALLLQDEDGPDDGLEILAPLALSRITGDIRRQTLARTRLQDAQKEARRRIRTGGRFSGQGSSVERDARPRGDVVFTYETDLSLRRAAADGPWSVWLGLPSLSILAARSPEIERILRSVQAVCPAAPDTMIARGRLLNEADPRLRLGRWPAPGETLLSFPGVDLPDLTRLAAAVSMPADNFLLFKVRSDGSARCLRRTIVSPGNSYVVIVREPVDNPAGPLEKLEITCDGAHGIFFAVPSAPSDVFISLMDVLGLTVKHTVDVWAAGVRCAEWTDDDVVTWVAGGPIVLGVHTDQAVSDIELRFAAREDGSVRTGAVPAGSDLFFDLGMPPVGSSTASVTVTREATDGSPDVVSTDLHLVVREPSQDARTTGPVSFSVSPEHPTMEDVWSGDVKLHLASPGPQKCKLRARLLRSDSRSIVWESGGAHLQLPLVGLSWRSAFESLVTRDCRAAYDEAHAIRLDFIVTDVGTATVTAEREFTSVRWIVRDGGRRVELLNSTAMQPEVVIASCKHPMTHESVRYADAVDGIEVTAAGMLVTARVATYEAALVCVPPQIIRGDMSQLAVHPRVEHVPRDPADVADALRIARSWEAARRSGSVLSESRQKAAYESIMAEVLAAVAGESWGSLERSLAGDPAVTPGEVAARMSATLEHKRQDKELRQRLEARFAEEPPTDVHSLTDSFASAASTAIHGSSSRSDDEKVARFALALASSAKEALALAGDSLEDLIRPIVESPAVVRVGRYCVKVHSQRFEVSDDVGA